MKQFGSANRIILSLAGVATSSLEPEIAAVRVFGLMQYRFTLVFR